MVFQKALSGGCEENALVRRDQSQGDQEERLAARGKIKVSGKERGRLNKMPRRGLLDTRGDRKRRCQ